MRSKYLVAAAAIAIATIGSVPASAPAHARLAYEAEIVGLHQLCNRGDRRACHRLRQLVERHHHRHPEWRRHHREWYWWER